MFEFQVNIFLFDDANVEMKIEMWNFLLKRKGFYTDFSDVNNFSGGEQL